MELNSHANMVLLGKGAFIFDGVQGRTCNVIPYDPSLSTRKQIPIVDGAVAYDCPYLHQTFIFLFQNALHIPTLEHSLIPPFILREAGIQVNNTPKIHTTYPTTESHSIHVPEYSLRIPLQLNDTLSYFHVRMPTNDEI